MNPNLLEVTYAHDLSATNSVARQSLCDWRLKRWIARLEILAEIFLR